MTDYSALRRLAHEASETEMGWLDRDWLSGIMADDWADYVAAVDPDVVIALIAENERLDRESQNLSNQLGACDRERRQFMAENDRLRQGVAGDFDLDAWLEWVKEATKLRADNEVLRKALRSAEDVMWKAESNMDNEAADIRDLLAAMDQGERSDG